MERSHSYLSPKIQNQIHTNKSKIRKRQQETKEKNTKTDKKGAHPETGSRASGSTRQVVSQPTPETIPPPTQRRGNGQVQRATVTVTWERATTSAATEPIISRDSPRLLELSEINLLATVIMSKSGPGETATAFRKQIAGFGWSRPC